MLESELPHVNIRTRLHPEGHMIPLDSHDANRLEHIYHENPEKNITISIRPEHILKAALHHEENPHGRFLPLLAGLGSAIMANLPAIAGVLGALGGAAGLAAGIAKPIMDAKKNNAELSMIERQTKAIENAAGPAGSGVNKPRKKSKLLKPDFKDLMKVDDSTIPIESVDVSLLGQRGHAKSALRGHGVW